MSKNEWGGINLFEPYSKGLFIGKKTDKNVTVECFENKTKEIPTAR